MAVSLVSTGVQFPDSTIQTTAATSSVFTSGSIVLSGVTGIDFGGGGVHVLQNPSTADGTSVIWTGSPPEDQAITTGLSQNRMSSKEKVRHIKPDFYNGGLLAQTQATYDYGGSNLSLKALVYSKTGRSDWTSIAQTSGSNLQGAINHYTGRTIWTIMQNYTTVFSSPAGTPYFTQGTNYTSVSPNSICGEDVTPNFLNFLDLGSQAASKFFIGCRAQYSNNYYVMYSVDGVSWSAVAADSSGKNWYNATFVGNSTEIIAGHGNGSSTGLLRSTDSGSSWTQYAFGNSSSGTNNSYYPTGLTHNGTYWLAIDSNSGRLVSKTMGSSTTWAQVSGYSGSSVGWSSGNTPRSVTWNSADSKWYVLAGNYDALMSNSSSDPQSGTWVLANHFGSRYMNNQYQHIMAISSQSLNPYMWYYN